jgi:hypothetical protein
MLTEIESCCWFPCRNLYYKIAKARPSTPHVKQQFMLPSSVFEFGPVLAGRDRAALPDGHPDHTAKFRITNNGLFLLHADFWLKSEGPSADPAAAAAGIEVKKKAGNSTCSLRDKVFVACTVHTTTACCSMTACTRKLHTCAMYSMHT